MSISASLQVSLVAEERDRNINRVQELEASITELKNAAGKRLTMLLSSVSSSSWPSVINLAWKRVQIWAQNWSYDRTLGDLWNIGIWPIPVYEWSGLDKCGDWIWSSLTCYTNKYSWCGGLTHWGQTCREETLARKINFSKMEIGILAAPAHQRHSIH